jgi:hypothetical protein
MHCLLFLITEKNFQKQVIFTNLIVNVTTNQYQYKMKNESSQRTFILLKIYNHKWHKPPYNMLRGISCTSEGDQHFLIFSTSVDSL